MPKLLVIGAHPDDAEFKAGGLAALYRKRGFPVTFVSVTNGDAGHHQIRGEVLARRRREEARKATEPLGIDARVWDYPDGKLVPSLAVREANVRLIRLEKPDLVLTHRPNDYHPDHRAVSQLVQDAAYMLTVPPICPEVPHLRCDPVIAYLSDAFTKPYPFTPSVAVDVTSVWSEKIDLLDAHRSQFYEWLPYNARKEDQFPTEPAAQRGWLDDAIEKASRKIAEMHKDWIFTNYPKIPEVSLGRVELFEGCEYGAPLDEVAIATLFPFG